MSAVSSTTTSSTSRAKAREAGLGIALGLAGASIAAGFLLAMIWSYELVDTVIGDTVADTVLGYDAKQIAINGSLGGIVFAFVSGFAGTFTACNIAVFGALPQVVGTPDLPKATGPLRMTLSAMRWVVVGILAVSAPYGAIAVLLGDRLPQLSAGILSTGIPERLMQSVVVFGIIGCAFAYLGLATLGVLPNPLDRYPRGRLIILGALIGGFLIGRPYPLFHKLLDYAVSTQQPAFGAVVMILQSLGNILVVGLLAALFAAVARLLPKDKRPKQLQIARVSGVMLLVLGTFLIFYWDVRLPALFGVGFFPRMPWN